MKREECQRANLLAADVARGLARIRNRLFRADNGSLPGTRPEFTGWERFDGMAGLLEAFSPSLAHAYPLVSALRDLSGALQACYQIDLIRKRRSSAADQSPTLKEAERGARQLLDCAVLRVAETYDSWVSLIPAPDQCQE